MTRVDSLFSPPASSDRKRRPRPSRQTWRVFLAYALGVQVVWLVVYGGASRLTEIRSLRVSFATPWDDAVPFVPGAAVVYLSLPAMLWLAPFLLPNPLDVEQFGKRLVAVILVAGIGFVALPADQPPVPRPVDGLGAAAFRLADRVNLSHNLFPSLHVAMATLSVLTFSRNAEPMAKAALAGWAGGIAASTLLIRDHYVADVLGGAALGAAAFFAGGRSEVPPSAAPSDAPTDTQRPPQEPRGR